MFKLVFLKKSWAIGNQSLYERLREIGNKIYTNELGHITNMATMPIYGKNLTNLLLQNHLFDDLET